ncbi:hypothetical protein LZM17_29195 [Pseudomonas aeruginosa]|nr:hypothetical protein [Pseudomonas aeruginosa]
MRTIGEIIEATKAGERADYDELRYTICAMDALMTFDRQAIWKLAEAESEGKKPFLVYSAVWQRDENFGRIKRALAKPPKEYVGPNNDPDSPEVQERRRKFIALFDKVAESAKAKESPRG